MIHFLCALLTIVMFLVIMQEYRRPSGFACPWVPLLPVLSIGFNMFLFAQVKSGSNCSVFSIDYRKAP